MELCEPIHQILAIFIWNLILKASIQKVGWVHVPDLFFAHVHDDLRDEFNNWLWVSYLKHIIEVQLGLILSQPFLSTVFLHFKDLLEFVIIKSGPGQLNDIIWHILIRSDVHGRLLLIDMSFINQWGSWVLLHTLGLELVAVLIVHKHLVVHWLVVQLIHINHHLQRLLVFIVGNSFLIHLAVTWIYRLIDHHGLWHWLRLLNFLALQLLHGIVAFGVLTYFVASICGSHFWVLRILGDFVVLGCAI